MSEGERQRYHDIKDLNSEAFREQFETHLSDNMEISSFDERNVYVNKIGQTFKEALDVACPYIYRLHNQKNLLLCKEVE